MLTQPVPLPVLQPVPLQVPLPVLQPVPQPVPPQVLQPVPPQVLQPVLPQAPVRARKQQAYYLPPVRLRRRIRLHRIFLLNHLLTNHSLIRSPASVRFRCRRHLP